MPQSTARGALEVSMERLRLKAPFRISGHTFEAVPVIVAKVASSDGLQGRGEAAGVYYLDDHPEGMVAPLMALAPQLEAGLSRQALRELLPPGGARNALDCALWDLEAQLSGRPAWAIAGLAEIRPLLTTFTLGADAPDRMALEALAVSQARAIKLKLTGETELDMQRVRAVRAARPDVWLGVDANQGFTPDSLEPLVAVLADCGVSLLEQPFVRGSEALMDGLDLPLPTAADESCLDLSEIEALVGRFDVVNIKLDKCGGLTEALMMAQRAKALGLKVMVGNMVGSCLAMAPGMVLGQVCDLVDLDGATFLAQDRDPAMVYQDGEAWAPAEAWGAPRGSPSATTPRI